MRICGTKLSLCIFLSIPNGIREIGRKEDVEGGNERSRERVRKAGRCGGRK